MSESSHITVTSPVTGEVVANFRELTPERVREQVERLSRRFDIPGSSSHIARSRLERCSRLDNLASVIERDIDALVEELILEHGKPVAEAQGEIAEAADMIRVTASHARAFSSELPVVADSNKRFTLSDLPVGIVGVITPWNLPYYVPFEYLAPALALGNSVVWKPAESTPLSNRRISAMLTEVGFGEDELVYLEGGPATGQALVDCDGLDAIGFTGSTEVGMSIRSVSRGRPLLLEMGGNGPTIVFADANLEHAAAGIAFASFWCAGQSCSAAERVLVEDSVRKDFLEALVEAARSYEIGDPRVPETQLGPLHQDENSRRMARHVDEAASLGARVVAGGAPAAGYPTSRYWPATILDDVPVGASVFKEETFGPIAPITGFVGETQALDYALNGNWGLESSVYTSDIDRALRIADQLPAGFVVINDHSNYWEPQIPFGGGRGTLSGVGRLGIQSVLRFMSQPRAVAIHQS